MNAIASFLGMIVEQIMKPLRELLATPDVTRHADLKRLWAGSMGITAGIYVLFVTAGGITVMGYGPSRPGMRSNRTPRAC